MTLQQAIALLKEGKRVRRASATTYLFLVFTGGALQMARRLTPDSPVRWNIAHLDWEDLVADDWEEHAAPWPPP